MNRTATATSSRDISAQTTALLLSTLSITLAMRTKSLNFLPIASVRWTAYPSWARSASLLCQALAPPSPPCTLARRLQLTATSSHLLQLQSLPLPNRQAIIILAQPKRFIAIIIIMRNLYTLLRYIQHLN